MKYCATLAFMGVAIFSLPQVELVITNPEKGQYVSATDTLRITFDLFDAYSKKLDIGAFGLLLNSSFIVCFLLDGERVQISNLNSLNCRPLLELWPNASTSNHCYAANLLPGRRTVHVTMLDTSREDNIVITNHSIDFFVTDVDGSTPIDLFSFRANSVLVNVSRQEIFDEVYKLGFWNWNGIYSAGLDSGIDDTATPSSGEGSTLASTELIREALEEIIISFNVTSIFDAACGDMFWISHVADGMKNIDYIGADISTVIMQRNLNRLNRLWEHLKRSEVNTDSAAFSATPIPAPTDVTAPSFATSSSATHFLPSIERDFDSYGQSVESTDVDEMPGETMNNTQSCETEEEKVRENAGPQSTFSSTLDVGLLNMLSNAKNIRLAVFDLVSQDLPADVPLDLVLCRHVMFHLHREDNLELLRRVERSHAKYFMATTSIRLTQNFDDYTLLNGHKINLLAPPYCLRDPIRLYKDSSAENLAADTYMGLWEIREDQPLIMDFC